MFNRCNNKNNPAYKNYGERGIKVCERWRYFPNFLEDMGESPENLTLERIDNGKGYCKENCRWATRLEQNRNRRSNVKFLYKGNMESISKIADMEKVDYKRFRYYLSLGFSLNDALVRAKDKSLNRRKVNSVIIDYLGRTYCLTEFCREFNLNVRKVKRNLNKHPIDKIFELAGGGFVDWKR